MAAPDFDYVRRTTVNAGGITAAATTLEVPNTAVSGWPSPSVSSWLPARIRNADGSVWEDIRITGRVGNVLTIVRDEGGTNQAWPSGSVVEVGFTETALESALSAAGLDVGGDWSVEYESGTALSVHSTTGMTTASYGLTVNTTSAASALVVDDATGNIGIGTAAPASNALSLRRTAVGVGVSLYIRNDDNTSGVSHALQWITSGGASGGDAYTRWEVNGAQSWSAGVDNSDSDKFKIAASSVVSSNVALDIASTTQMVTCSKGLTVNTSATGAIAAVTLSQSDTDEQFIEFTGTESADAASSLSSWTTGGSINGFIRVSVNGTDRWIPTYTAPTS